MRPRYAYAQITIPQRCQLITTLIPPKPAKADARFGDTESRKAIRERDVGQRLQPTDGNSLPSSLGLLYSWLDSASQSFAGCGFKRGALHDYMPG